MREKDIVVGENEYPVKIFDSTGGGLENGVSLTIEQDSSGDQRVSIWEIPETDKHVISLEREDDSVASNFDSEFKMEITGSDSVALREFIANFEEVKDLDEDDYILTSKNSDLAVILSQIVEQVEEIDDGRSKRVLSEMIRGIATLGNEIDDFDISQEVLDTDALRAESMIQQARISNGVSKLESKIDESASEGAFQSLFESHPWFFGNQYVEQLDREILRDSEVDFALQSINNYLDIFEIKTPDASVVKRDSSHDNWVPRSELTEAIVQLQNYIHESERLQNIIENDQGVQVLKPRGTIVIGSNLEQSKRDGLRLIESHLNRVSVVTFTDLLHRAKQMMQFHQRRDASGE